MTPRFDSLNLAVQIAKQPEANWTARQARAFDALIARVHRTCFALTREELADHVKTMPVRLGLAA